MCLCTSFFFKTILMGNCIAKVSKHHNAVGSNYTLQHRCKSSPLDFLDTFDFNVHIVKLNTSYPGNIETLFMNEAAIRTYGPIIPNSKWVLIPILGEVNMALLIDHVVNRNKLWKCIVYDDMQQSDVPTTSSRNSGEEQTSSHGSNETVESPSLQLYAPQTQIQRALMALSQQRKFKRGSSRQIKSGLGTTVINRKWYEIRAFPFFFEGGNSILVVQYNVTKHVQRNTALLRMADNHLKLLQQLYPRHFILDNMDGVSMMEHSNFESFSDHHDSVIVMFADIVGFTSMCKVVTPEQVMHFLLNLYQEFDKLVCGFPDLFKYEVAGDCYIVVGGLVNRDTHGFSSTIRKCITKNELKRLATNMIKLCVSIQEAAKNIKMPHNPDTHVMLHIGVHVGPVVSGIIGLTSPKFMLFGDTMNTASRMESTCPPGKIQVSNELYQLLPAGSISGGGVWTQTKGVEVKGKGLMDTWLLVSASPTNLSPSITDESS